jgi:putative membrane protein
MMTADLTLAILHHLAVFALVALLAAEFALARPGMSREAVMRVAKVDSWYGITAALVIAIGVCRVVWGAKGWDFYQSNPFFWAKMACFAAVGILSLPPTLRFIAWRRAHRHEPEAEAPTDADVKGVRRFFMVEALFLTLVPVFAAAMARWQG